MERKTRTFNLGNMVITPNAAGRLLPGDVSQSLARHASCDWGDCVAQDAAENEQALDRPRRLFSVYHDQAGERFWIITEADRSCTTILLPEDY